jgi:hypothetical protein
MRKLTQAELLLRHLTNRPGATAMGLVTELGIPKYTSRISDLRAKGHVIECRKREDGELGYFIVPKRVAA